MKPIDADALREKFADVLNSTYTDDYAKVFVAGLYAAMNMPTLTPPNEWVSVEERLPENSAEVLMWREKWKIAEAGTYRNACFLVYDALGDSYKADDITYWMPLPAPPDSRPPEGKNV